jgi:hypothetical protein
MRTLPIVLKLVAPIFFLVGALHLTFGIGADVLLGAKLPVEAIADPALDSQNRFYGVAFTLYGVLLFLCATNLPRYAPVLRCLLWVFFAGGVARIVSMALYGFPPPLVMLLFVGELLPPPLLVWWLGRVEKQNRLDYSYEQNNLSTINAT